MTIEDVQIDIQIFLCSSKSPSNTAYEKIQLKDINMRRLYFVFNNILPFTHGNFKTRDVRDVWIPISKSVREYYER